MSTGPALAGVDALAADAAPEQWRPVVGYEGYYEVSNQGRVRSVDRITVQNHFLVGRVLKQSVAANKYLSVTLAKDGPRMTHSVHALVAEAFHGARPNADVEVRHLNGVRSDNRAANLRWGTRSENQLDIVRHGRNPHSQKTHCPQGHPYAGDNLMRVRRSDGRMSRKCARCNRERVARYYARKKAELTPSALPHVAEVEGGELWRTT